jgi:hypothetical protein
MYGPNEGNFCWLKTKTLAENPNEVTTITGREWYELAPQKCQMNKEYKLAHSDSGCSNFNTIKIGNVLED